MPLRAIRPAWLALSLVCATAFAQPRFPSSRKESPLAVNTAEVQRLAEQRAQVQFSVGGRILPVELEPNDLRAPGHRAVLLTPDGEQEIEPRTVTTYKGRVAGEPSSRVRLSITGESVSGYIVSGGEWHFIEPRASKAHYTYSISDVEMSRSLGEDFKLVPGNTGKQAAAAAALGTNPLTAVIVLDGDYEFYSAGPTNWIERQQEILNLVEGVYQREVQVRFQIRLQYAHQAPDSLVSTALCSDAEDLLDQVRTFWQGRSEGRHLLHLLTGKSIQGSTIGCAYLDALGGTYAYGVSEIAPSRPIYQRTILVAHEIGHNFNGRHDLATETTIMWPTTSSRSTDRFSDRNRENIRTKAEAQLCEIAPGSGASREAAAFTDLYFKQGGRTKINCATSAVQRWIRSDVQEFSGGGAEVLPDGNTTAYWAAPQIWNLYKALGPDAIGLPVADSREGNSGASYVRAISMAFERGEIHSYLSGPRIAEANVVAGAVLARWKSVCSGSSCGSAGPMGLPLSHEMKAASARLQLFESGRIYILRSGIASYLPGVIATAYANRGAEGGPLGLPTGDLSSDGPRVDFEGGYIRVQSGAAQVVLRNIRTTIQTNPPGLTFTVDGVSYTSAQTFAWDSGSRHTISVSSMQTLGSSRYDYTNWSNGGALTQTITVQENPATYTASFAARHRLAVSADTGGSVSAQPAGDYIADGTAVLLAAVANTGYRFAGWTGDVLADAATITVTMDAPKTLTARFVQTGATVVTTSPPGLAVIVDGTTYTVPKTFAWAAGTSHTLGVASPQAPAGAQYAFTGWSNGGAQSQTVTAATGAQVFTASFSARYQLNSSVNPPGAGTITRSIAPADGYHSPGQAVELTAAAAPGYYFTGWSGAVTGTAARQTVTVARAASVTANFAPLNACWFTLPVKGAIPWNGESSTIQLTAQPAGCSWTASSSTRWATVYPLGGTGSMAITYNIGPNYSTGTRTTTFSLGGVTLALTQTAAPGSADERFVGKIYYNVFGRVPAASEVAYQVNEGLRKGLSRASLVTGFFNSQEFNAGGRFAAGLYVGLLNRDAEYGGWLFQRNALATGLTSTQTLVANFLGSAEYALKFGNPTDAEFVRLLYRYVLLREASAAEVSFQTSALASGTTRTQIAVNFLNSGEFRAGAGPRLTAFLLYALLLERDPSSSDLAWRASQIQAGGKLETLIQDFLNTAEFAASIE